MDAGLIGSVVLVLFVFLFAAIVWWAYHRGNKEKFEDAAQLPFREESGKAREPD